jgi:hypothetical protein
MPGPLPPSPMAPWHMWGNSVRLLGQGAGHPVNFTNQVARINYRRPENWRFFLGARLTGGDVVGGPVPLACTISFALILGVGRSVFLTKDRTGLPIFMTFTFLVPIGSQPGLTVNNVKYVTTVDTPPIDDNVVGSTRTIDHFVAQDVQCQATLTIVTGSPTETVIGEATAFFAPNVHVRPDWFMDQESRRFGGSEPGGT